MTGQDGQRELDEWVAAQLGWEQVGDDWHRKSRGNVEIAFSLPSFTKSPWYFAQVKREIERRGWTWYASWSPYNERRHYYFGVDSSEPPHSIVHTETAEREELAGCLAFKAAVEATDNEDTS